MNGYSFCILKSQHLAIPFQPNAIKAFCPSADFPLAACTEIPKILSSNFHLNLLIIYLYIFPLAKRISLFLTSILMERF